ncbi:hypothetical protein ACIQ1J_09535 [Streptomyces sp. NPDC097107]|uniref:hypothetical protein n=1 Tax=Streptomyces sp. NPDC097107 TaxID=3366089 RepID=UPI003819029D
MAELVLSVVVVLVLGGLVCVVRAEARGGPRWVRAVSAVTLAAGELVRSSKGAGRGGGGRNDSGD